MRSEDNPEGTDPAPEPDPYLEAGPEPDPYVESPRHLVPVPSSHVPTTPRWDEARRLYVQGIAVGPSYPDRTEILAAVGEADILTRPRRGGGHNKVTKVGSVSIVFPTLRAVAHYFGISERQGIERARDEDWWGLQRIYRSQLHQQAGIVKGRQRLVDVEKIDRRGYAVAKLGMKMVQERLEMMTQTVEVMDGEVNPVTDYKELESLSRAATVWHTLARRALGFPVDKVGVVGDMGVGAELGLTEFGLYHEGEVVEAERVDDYSAAIATDSGEMKPSVGVELARDDSERLAGFLSVLGRAQDASQADPNADDQTQTA